MQNKISEMENLFLALADKTRLRILNLIGDGEVCVFFFTEALREPQSKISRHLAYLRRAGVVETARRGKWIYYRVAQSQDESARRVFDEIQTWIATDEGMQMDLVRLRQIRLAPQDITFESQQKSTTTTISQKREEPDFRREQLEDFLL
jgi:ArsR family transcriptional regulator